MLLFDKIQKKIEAHVLNLSIQIHINVDLFYIERGKYDFNLNKFN